MDEQEIKQLISKKVSIAKIASTQLGLMDFKQRNAILLSIANALEKNISEIQFHNDIDVETAKKVGFEQALIDRLTLTTKRIEDMIHAVRSIVNQKDTIGEIL